MSSRLSPFDTASLCSWPSLSINVTQSSSPGFGGSTWPCRVDGVDENGRTDSDGEGRMERGKVRRAGEAERVLGIVVRLVLVLPNRRRYGREGFCVEEGRRRVKDRTNVRGVAMTVRKKIWRGGGTARKRGGKKRRGPGRGAGDAAECEGLVGFGVSILVSGWEPAAGRSASPTGAA